MMKDLLKKPHTYLQVAIAAVVGLTAYASLSYERNKARPVVIPLLSEAIKESAKAAAIHDQIVSQSQQGHKAPTHNPIESASSSQEGEGHSHTPAPPVVSQGTAPIPAMAPETSLPENRPQPEGTPAPTAQVIEAHPHVPSSSDHDASSPKTMEEAQAQGHAPSPVSTMPPQEASHGADPQQGGASSAGVPAPTQAAPGGSSQETSVVALPPVPVPPPPPGKIALLVLDLGKQENLLEAALGLPKEVAFGVHTGLDTQGFHAKLKEAGHETFLMIPMEPLDYPESDPGFAPLLTGLPAQENVQRLQAHLKDHLPMVGVVPFLGSRFMFSEKDLFPVLEALARQHLLFVDVKSSPQSVVKSMGKKANIPVLAATFCLDQICQDEAAWQAQQEKLATLAKEHGPLFVFVHGSPFALDRLKALFENLTHLNLKLVPVSSLAVPKKET